METNRLEYTFGAYTSHLSDRVRNYVNPFTKQVIEAPIDNPLTEDECSKIRCILADYCAELDSCDDAYVWRISEKDSVRVCWDFSTVHRPIGFEIEIVATVLTDEILAFILHIAQQGNLVFRSSVSTKIPVCLVNEPQDPKINLRWPIARTVKTITELRNWIETEIGHCKIR